MWSFFLFSPRLQGGALHHLNIRKQTGPVLLLNLPSAADYFHARVVKADNSTWAGNPLARYSIEKRPGQQVFGPQVDRPYLLFFVDGNEAERGGSLVDRCRCSRLLRFVNDQTKGRAARDLF
jgi:hypothetical protein